MDIIQGLVGTQVYTRAFTAQLESKRTSGSLQGNLPLTGQHKLRNVFKAGFIILPS